MKNTCQYSLDKVEKRNERNQFKLKEVINYEVHQNLFVDLEHKQTTSEGSKEVQNKHISATLDNAICIEISWS